MCIDEGSAGHPELGADFEFAPEFRSVGVTGEEALIGREDGAGGVGGFLKELDSEVAEAGGEEFVVMGGAGLGDGVEEGIPAADIGAEGVFDAHAVAEVDAVGLARAAAIKEGRAF